MDVGNINIEVVLNEYLHSRLILNKHFERKKQNELWVEEDIELDRRHRNLRY